MSARARHGVKNAFVASEDSYGLEASSRDPDVSVDKEFVTKMRRTMPEEEEEAWRRGWGADDVPQSDAEGGDLKRARGAPHADDVENVPFDKEFVTKMRRTMPEEEEEAWRRGWGADGGVPQSDAEYGDYKRARVGLDAEDVEDVQEPTAAHASRKTLRGWNAADDVSWPDDDGGVFKRVRVGPHADDERITKLLVVGDFATTINIPIDPLQDYVSGRMVLDAIRAKFGIPSQTNVLAFLAKTTVPRQQVAVSVAQTSPARSQVFIPDDTHDIFTLQAWVVKQPNVYFELRGTSLELNMFLRRHVYDVVDAKEALSALPGAGAGAGAGAGSSSAGGLKRPRPKSKLRHSSRTRKHTNGKSKARRSTRSRRSKARTKAGRAASKAGHSRSRR